jgi:tetratricopeptide (TPR) repeat protein
VDIAHASEDWWHASELSRRLGDSTGIGESLLGLGRIALEQARYTDATVLLRRAMQPFAVFEHRERLADILLLLSRVHGLQGQFAEASRLVECVLASEESQQRESLLAACRVWQGEMAISTAHYRIAGEMLQRAERHGQRSQTPEVVAQSHSGLAEVFLCRGRWGQAIVRAKEALQISLSVDVPVIVARAQQVLALVYARIGAYQEGDKWIQQTLSTLGDQNWRVALGSTYWIGGQVRLGLRRLDEAEEWFGQALALGRESNTVRVVVRAQLGLGGVAAARGDWPEAQRLYSESKARARGADLDHAVLEARLGLADACAARQDLRRAQSEALQALDSATRLQCPYEELVACAILDKALSGLHQKARAAQYQNDARRLAAQLVQTLPESLRQAFLDQPHIRALSLRSSSRAA